jgi:hypothetical protein
MTNIYKGEWVIMKFIKKNKHKIEKYIKKNMPKKKLKLYIKNKL